MTDMHQPYSAIPAAQTNGFAIAALVLGIWGFCTTAIPFFVGLFVGGIPDILAIIFGAVALSRAAKIGGSGRAMAAVGLALGIVGTASVFIGAGTIW